MLPVAAEDVKEAAEWYNKKKPGLGRELLSELRKGNPSLHFCISLETKTF